MTFSCSNDPLTLAFLVFSVAPVEDTACRVLDYAISNYDINADGSIVIPADVTDIYEGAFIGFEFEEKGHANISIMIS